MTLKPFITLPTYIPQAKQCGSKQKKKTDAQMVEDFIGGENQDIYLYDRLVAEPKQWTQEY